MCVRCGGERWLPAAECAHGKIMRVLGSDFRENLHAAHADVNYVRREFQHQHLFCHLVYNEHMRHTISNISQHKQICVFYNLNFFLLELPNYVLHYLIEL